MAIRSQRSLQSQVIKVCMTWDHGSNYITMGIKIQIVTILNKHTELCTVQAIRTDSKRIKVEQKKEKQTARQLSYAYNIY